MKKSRDLRSMLREYEETFGTNCIDQLTLDRIVEMIRNIKPLFLGNTAFSWIQNCSKYDLFGKTIRQLLIYICSFFLAP